MLRAAPWGLVGSQLGVTASGCCRVSPSAFAHPSPTDVEVAGDDSSPCQSAPKNGGEVHIAGVHFARQVRKDQVGVRGEHCFPQEGHQFRIDGHRPGLAALCRGPVPTPSKSCEPRPEVHVCLPQSTQLAQPSPGVDGSGEQWAPARRESRQHGPNLFPAKVVEGALRYEPPTHVFDGIGSFPAASLLGPHEGAAEIRTKVVHALRPQGRPLRLEEPFDVLRSKCCQPEARQFRAHQVNLHCALVGCVRRGSSAVGFQPPAKEIGHASAAIRRQMGLEPKALSFSLGFQFASEAGAIDLGSSARAGVTPASIGVFPLRYPVAMILVRACHVQARFLLPGVVGSLRKPRSDSAPSRMSTAMLLRDRLSTSAASCSAALTFAGNRKVMEASRFMHCIVRHLSGPVQPSLGCVGRAGIAGSCSPRA